MKSKRRSSAAEKLLPRIVGGRISEMATYSDLFENTPHAIFLLETETLAVLDHNPAARAFLGVSSSQIDERSFLEWAMEEYRPLLENNLRALRVEHQVWKPFDCAIRGMKNSTPVLELSLCRLKLADYCQVIQVIGKDVTEARADAAALARAHAELDRISRTDVMTGLHNFRSLQARLAEEHERARRYGKPYAVILCDIDHFKNYNDRNGHLEGNKALQVAAEALRQRARNIDFVARYGGEEFVVLCPETTAEQALVFAEGLRVGVERTEFAHGKKQPLGRLTISLGVAAFPQSGRTAEAVLRAADEALYLSKEDGRNRATLFGAKAGAPRKDKKKAA